MAKQRLSELQRIIIEELSKTKDKCSLPETLSLRVAKRYDSTAVWSLVGLEEKLKAKGSPPELIEMALSFGSGIHRKKELVKNKFSATFSRSLRNLEQKGLVHLIKGQFKGDAENPKVIYRVVTKQPRISLVVHKDSPYFGDTAADANWIVNFAQSLNYNIHVNNKASTKRVKKYLTRLLTTSST